MKLLKQRCTESNELDYFLKLARQTQIQRPTGPVPARIGQTPNRIRPVQKIGRVT